MARKKGNVAEGSDGDGPVRIKKYANRRLYNTATSSYVTLDDLCTMVKEGQEFVVNDAKSGEDITRSVLTQIIVEEEAKGENMLPIGFLRQLISFYGDSMQWMVPRYLEHSMHSFARNQEQLREYVQGTMQGMFPFGSMSEMGKQNMAMLETAMKMFSPFPGENGEQGREPPKPPAVPDMNAQAALQIQEMQRQLEALRAELAALSKDGKDKPGEDK
ncbi:MAG: polyhydroxyalkanoate synthesis repressor PhaR [Pseudomonadota bacterium]